MLYCTKCGHQVSETALACPACGALRHPETPSMDRQSPAEGVNICKNCGRSFGAGRSCQFCHQVEGASTGITIASPARRLGGYLLEPLLFLVTLGLEYLIWGLITFAHGQTPGKQVLGMRVVRLNDGHAVGFGLSLVREVIAKPVIGVLSLVTFGIVNFWLLWDKDKQELWDKVVGTIVVNDRRGLTLR